VLKTTTISIVSNLSTIRGGAIVAAKFTENPCIISDVNTCQTVTDPIKITAEIRCTILFGNGQDGNGNPCTY
jgi:hypothetical protein